jgi:hypothetical protein
MNLKSGAALSLTFLLAACQHTYDQVDLTKDKSGPKLSPASKIYVAVPPDASFKKNVIYDSGKMVAATVKDAFAAHAKKTYSGRNVETQPGALRTATLNKFDYVVYPSVIRWEDRATETSGLKDKIEIKIEVLSVETGEVVHGAVLKGRSRWLSDGNDHPRDLLAEPVTKYVTSLFLLTHIPTGLPEARTDPNPEKIIP